MKLGDLLLVDLSHVILQAVRRSAIPGAWAGDLAATWIEGCRNLGRTLA
jgi:hypothetical protein